LEAGKDERPARRSPWELVALFTALGIFAWLAALARPPQVAVSLVWIAILIAIALVLLAGAGLLLWCRTRFS
jgi:hypothetical protein